MALAARVQRRAPRSLYPLGLERDYARRLKRRLRLAAKACIQVLVDEDDGDIRFDSSARDEARVRRAIGRVRMKYGERYTVVEDTLLAVQVEGRVEGYIERQTARQVKSVTGVDPLPTRVRRRQAEEFVEENVQLIQSLGEEFFDKLEDDILKAYAGGARHEQLSKVIRERYNVSARRAALIARDQMGTLSSKLAQAKQQEAGCIGYIWRTSQDERVVGNPSGMYPRGNDRHGNHHDREGVFFRWDQPPHDGHPGEAINCRCTAEPVWYEEDVEDVEKAVEKHLEVAPKGVASASSLISSTNVLTSLEAFLSEGDEEGISFPPQKLARLEKALSKIDVPVLSGEEGARFAKQMGGQAIYYPAEPGRPGFIAWGKGVPRTAVVEELIHLRQHRKMGYQMPTSRQLIELEIEAQKELIRLGQKLGWTSDEVEEIGRAKDLWTKKLEELNDDA